MPKTKGKEGKKIMKTMIYLDQEVHRQLRYMALDERTSMADLIRRAVDEFLKKHTKKEVRPR